MSRTERRVTFWLKTLALVAVAIYLLVGFLQFLGNVKATAILFVVALFFAYLIYPLVRRLNERLPLVWSILLVYLFIALVGAIIMQLLVPALASDVQGAVKTLPALVRHYGDVLQDPNNRFIHWLPLDERLYLASLPGQIGSFLQTNAFDTASKTLTVVLSTVSVLATVIVVPVLAAYMLLDAENIKRGFIGMVPAKNRPKAEAIIADLDKVVGGFIRGQLIDGSILGTMLTVMLSIMHVPYALLIGVVSGRAELHPVRGRGDRVRPGGDPRVHEQRADERHHRGGADRRDPSDRRQLRRAARAERKRRALTVLDRHLDLRRSASCSG